MEVVKRLYEQEITELNSNSAVKEFIGVIASRRVRQRLLSARSHAARYEGGPVWSIELAAPKLVGEALAKSR
jgi:hypothetical protein